MAFLRTARFDSAIGPCTIGWTEQGIARVRLIDDAPGADTPSPGVEQAIKAIQAVIRGEPRDCSAIPLDLAGCGEFERRVYAITQAIPFGSTRTYGEIAREAGEPGAARAVGQAMGRNPVPILVPCHRVLAAGVKLGGFSAPGGLTTKQKLLRAEGILKAEQTSLFGS